MQPPTKARRPRAARLAPAAAAVAALTAFSAFAASVPAQADGASPQAAAKIDSRLLDTVESGTDTAFFVVLNDRADFSKAKAAHGHAKKAEAAYAALRETAAVGQKPLKAFLNKEKVGYQSYWIANTLRVTGDEALVEELAARKDVAQLIPSRTYKIDSLEQQVQPDDASTQTTAPDGSTVEWGIHDTKADQVWDQYGDRGEGIVIGSIDSGVQGSHPALKTSYRGWTGTTSVPDYNWYDPSGVCGPSAPCDNQGHGTHTMGTMVGTGGIGMAPGAKWIAAKGCESNQCSDPNLLAAGQWMLAPTDRNGQNPRPDLAPDVINNSWGNGKWDASNENFYQDMLTAWHAAGIMDAFAAGNDGDGVTCSTTHPPGATGASFAVGAYGADGKIAHFSGFGPSPIDGSMRPNITAPGVGVRSAYNNGGYTTMDGTSMATPHVTGAIALLLSAAPSLIGNIDATRALLNDSAVDVDDTHCGGTAGANNVWGNGKLDILAAVDAAPHSAVIVTGTVADKATGAALKDITIKADGTDFTRTVMTDADGHYRLTLPEGSYTLTLSGYGYATATDTGFEVTAGERTTHDLTMNAVPHHAVTGTVLDVTGKPLAGATVSVPGTPVTSATSDASGHYALDVAEGSYTLKAVPAAPVKCNGEYTAALTVNADESRTVSLPNRTDAGGTYTCAPVATSWIAGTTKTSLTGDEDALTVNLPFPVKYYGVSYNTASVTTNGLVNFLQPRLGDYANVALPSAGQPNGVVAAFWDDLTLDKKSSVYTATTGTAGSRKFAIVWNNAALAADTSVRLSFEAVFDEATGAITLQYQGVDGTALERGGSATTGIENQAGTDGLGYSFNQAVVDNTTAIRFTPKAA
ncbi:S8 family serine peptidase [Streptomyces sp. bgisy031]|uniref:S8 family serine peptidase n=1 Tax=Streptomyces sp. bgisy031 TaxID=3413772 RepID=UPI003D755D0D